MNEINALSEGLKSKGHSAQSFQVDATNENEIENFYKQIIDKEKKLDIVFNGIGLRAAESGYGTPSTIVPLETFIGPIQTILVSQLLTARLGARHMQETKSQGTILMLTASLSRTKVPFMAGKTATCSAIEVLTRAFAKEFGMFGIKVIGINPGGMPETRTIQETTNQMSEKLGIPISAMKEQQKNNSLLKRNLTTTDTAKVAVFLSSDAGASLNSHIVDVDFGLANVI